MKIFAKGLAEMCAGRQGVTFDWVSPSTLFTSTVQINSRVFIA